MSTEKIEYLVDVVSQWDAALTDSAWAEIMEIRRMCRALLAGGLDYTASSSAAFIDAVKQVRQIASEKP